MLKKRHFLSISFAILLNLMTVPWSLAKAESPVIQARRANHVPVAYDLAVKTKEDTPVGIILWATDQDGDPLTYEITSQPSHGKLEGSGQRWTYTPSRDFNGTDRFTYKAYDGKAWSKDARVTIHVRKANDAPQAQGQDVITAEDTPLAITLSATDVDGDSLVYSIVTPPGHGTLSGTPPEVTYTPNANYAGKDRFTFRAYDGKVWSKVARVSITVTPVKNPPVAQDQSVTTDEDVAKTITLLATDADGDPLTYQIVTQPSHGTISGTPPSVIYTPAGHYYGPDSFTFKANDGKVDSNIATVSISVVAANHPPVAQGQTVSTNEGTAKPITLSATDSDGDTLTYQVVSSPAHGTLSGAPPSLTYTPSAGYRGSDSFTFKANDGKLDSNIATVSITVIPVNHPPVAQDQSGITNEDTPWNVTLTATDSDGDSLSYQIVAQPAHGTLTGSGASRIYTPAAHYYGPDSFTFKANDGKVDSNIATVSITVIHVNHPPVAQDQSVTTDENVSKTITLSATDPDGDSLTYEIVNPPTNGQLSGMPPAISYVPNPGYRGADSFSFKVNDRIVDSNIAVISILVRASTQGIGKFSHFLPKENWVRLDDARGVTVGPDQSVYVTNRGSHPVRVFDKNGNLIKKWGAVGSGDGELNEPGDIALGPDGSIYVIDSGNVRIQKTDGNGNFIRNWGSKGNLDGQFYQPIGIICGPDGSVYVLDYWLGCIQKFDSNGNFVARLASEGTGDGQFNFPNGIAMGPDGYIYVADSANYRVQKLDQNGKFVAKWGSLGTGDGQFEYPTEIAVGPDGSVYVWDYNIGIQKFDSNGTFLGKLGSIGNGDGQFRYLSGIATGTDSSIYVSEGHRIQKFDRQGTFIGKWASYGSGDGQFGWSEGLAFGSDGSLFVIDTDNYRVQKFDRDGNFIIKWGNEGNGDGQFDFPEGIAVGPDDSVYVADTGNDRIQKYDKEGKFIRKWGRSGSKDGEFSGPIGIAIGPDNSVYVADIGNDRIQKFDPDGNFILKWGKTGSGDGELSWPNGVFVGPDNSVFVAEVKNGRIQKFDSSGNFIMKFGQEGDGDGEFWWPQGIAVDFDGSIYVADSGNDRIQKFDSRGNFLMKWGWSEDGYFDNPTGVAISPDGTLFVVDNGNSSIQRMDRETPQTGTMKGLVSEISTNSPLKDVMVTVKDSIREFTTKTDDNGTYLVTGLAAGDFTATFENHGYLNRTVTGQIGADETRVLDISLTPIPPLPSLILSIASPQDGMVVNSSPVIVRGNVNNNALVTVNGIPTAVTDNSFSVAIALVEGANSIKVAAADSYGQTASRSFQVFLVSSGTVTGVVRDALTGAVLPEAAAAVVDFSNPPKSAFTDNNGKYIITGVTPGAFQGTITKDGYQTYPLSGTVLAGETLTRDAALNPILPVLSNVQVTGMTMNSATITWTTDQPTDSFVEYGTTSSYGNWMTDHSLVTSHMLTINNLAIGTTYHFKVTSTNAFGMATSSVDSTFTTQRPLLTLAITSPSNGYTINRSDVLVKGTFINARGNETGVTVNGKVAMVVGNEFFVNHVPLQEGSNTIEAVATDTEGNTVNTSIGVNSIPAAETLTLTANVESGIAPLEVLLTITSSLDLTNASLTYIGPGEVELLSGSGTEYRVKITARGIYYFTLRVNSGDVSYEDSIGIAVLAPEELDNLLRSKWEGMKAKLAAKDIEGSLSFFTERKRSVYRNIFTTVASKLPLILQEMGDIQLIEVYGDAAIYDLRTVRDGVEYSFQLLFIRDQEGIWQIDAF